MALSDRFPNRNYLSFSSSAYYSKEDLESVSMEDTSTIFIRDGKGLIETLDELKKAYAEGKHLIIMENREEHIGNHSKWVKLSDGEIKRIIDHCEKKKISHIPDSVLENIRSEKTGYKYAHPQTGGGSFSSDEGLAEKLEKQGQDMGALSRDQVKKLQDSQRFWSDVPYDRRRGRIKIYHAKEALRNNQYGYEYLSKFHNKPMAKDHLENAHAYFSGARYHYWKWENS